MKQNKKKKKESAQSVDLIKNSERDAEYAAIVKRHYSAYTVAKQGFFLCDREQRNEGENTGK